MSKRIDLHLHTNQSDGVLAPSEVLAEVRKRDLRAFSITDHDTLAGYREVRSLIVAGDPELVVGVELSCSSDNGDLHMLAYAFDPDSERMLGALRDFREKRNRRGRLMVEKLNELKIDVSFDEVEKVAAGAPIGRPHVAEAMYRKKAVGTYEQAFEKYIGQNGPAFVPKPDFAPVQAIRLIHEARGVAVIAHPMINNTFEQIESLAGSGLDGIEVYHPHHKQSQTDHLKHLATRFRLLCCGGSDFHGREGRYGKIGSEPVPVEYLDRLKECAKQKRGCN